MLAHSRRNSELAGWKPFEPVSMISTFRLFFLIPILALAIAPAVGAQPAVADHIPAADSTFQAGIARFENGAYDEARLSFLEAATEFGYNDRTTAAWLMAARSAYALGDAEAMVADATTLTRQYPNSRYVPLAQELLDRITGGESMALRPLELGITLPTEGRTSYLAQAMFNGIRMAVDEHNASNPQRRVRMVFRNSGGVGESASVAMHALIEQGVSAIVGPLFSEEAAAAASAAADAGVVMLAPLATAASVSANRPTIFQMNPTFQERGRAMARYAVSELNMDRLGAVGKGSTFSEEMSSAFADETRRLGATVAFQEVIANGDDWGSIGSNIGGSRLAGVSGVYLPVTGDNASQDAADALRSIEESGATPRLLGNLEWEGLSGSRERASRMGAVFTQDFFVAPGTLADFDRRYRELAGVGPDRLALIGYDTARFLIPLMDRREEAPLADRIRNASSFQGLGHRFQFGGGQVNQALFIMAYRDGQAVLLQ